MAEELVRPRVVLFDIDGTLLVRSSAHLTSLTRAIGRRLGHPVAIEMRGERPLIDGHDMTGYIDAQVARALLGEQVAAAPALAGFLDGYADEFLRDLAGGASPGELVRGVPETLSDCAAAGIGLGLSTGNAARVARAKLTATGIERWFVFDPRAGFGDLADDRRGVAAAGVAGLAVAPSPTVWLIGDTPADMLAARAIGLTAVGVLTGAADARALRGAGANAILDSAAGVAALALAAPVELRPSE